MQIFRNWWMMLLLAIIVASSALLLYTLTVEEDVDIACSLIYENNVEEAKAQIDTIKNINTIGSNKETVLMAACRAGNIELLKYAIEKGADANKHPAGSLTPLELYCEYGYQGGADGVAALCAAGANPKEYTVQEPLFLMANIFQWMTDEQKDKATEVAVELIKNGASLYNSDTTILHLTAQADMYILFYNIIRSNEGVWLMNSKDGNGMTPYEVASKYGSVNVMRAFQTRLSELYIEQGLEPPEVLESSGIGPDAFFDIDNFLNQYLTPGATESSGTIPSGDVNDESIPDNGTDWGNGIIYLPDGEEYTEPTN